MLISRVYFWATSHTLSLVRYTKYTDGLYVLLKPPKKKKNMGDPTMVPSHLVDLVMPVPAETCPWQLSGPQFPRPTAIQQRYCYPRGPAEYSDRKGSSLWTMYNADGKEDEEFRLLHVYFSHKRAVNKGVIVPEAELAAAAAAYSMIRSPARGNSTKKRQAAHQLTSPPRRQSVHHRQHPHLHNQSKQSPAITSSTTSSLNSSPSLCSSPLSFDTMMPTSPARGFTTNTGASSLPLDLFRGNFHLPDAALLTPSPFRRGKLLSNYNNSSDSFHSIQQSPVITTRDLEEDDPFFASDMDVSMQEMDSYWDDPMLTMLDPSPEDVHSTMDDTDSPTLFTNNSTKTSAILSLAHSLDGVHDTIRKSIFAADHAEQPALVGLVAAWARRVAKDPLKSPAIPPEFPWEPSMRRLKKEEQHHGSGVDGMDHDPVDDLVDDAVDDHVHDDEDDDTVDAKNGQTAAV
jgi:hypothetical protein